MEPPQPIFTVEPPGAPPPRRPSGGLGSYRGTFLSMLLMIAVFAWFIGSWPVAIGVVLLIFVHEMGHVLAAAALGIPISAPIFIPFLGAAIVMRDHPRDAVVEALMAYAGPLAGCLGSWACLLLAESTGQGWLFYVAAISFQLNLFNLIPVPPLDGGRVCAAVSRWFWVPGLLLIICGIVYLHAWLSLLIGVLVLMSAFQRVRDELRNWEQMRQYYRINFFVRLCVAVFYVGLIGILLMGLADATNVLQPGGAY
jgi:Zn-dependent protease